MIFSLTKRRVQANERKSPETIPKSDPEDYSLHDTAPSYSPGLARQEVIMDAITVHAL